VAVLADGAASELPADPTAARAAIERAVASVATTAHRIRVETRLGKVLTTNSPSVMAGGRAISV
jgi:hypothetical protein